jgi:arsenate reductase
MQMAQEQVEAFSSGFEAGRLGGLPLEVMSEENLSFSIDPLTTIFERYANNQVFDYVITLCNEASTEQCPVFRTSVDMVYGKDAEIRNWSVMDFITLQGLPVEKLEGAREIRDSIKDNVSEFLLEIL